MKYVMCKDVFRPRRQSRGQEDGIHRSLHINLLRSYPQESLLTELVESVAYQQNPDCSENRSDDYGYTQNTYKKSTRYRNDRKNACDHSQISRTLTEDSL